MNLEPNPPQSGDGAGACQFPSWDLDLPVEFHHSTNQFQSHDLKNVTIICTTVTAPVENNQLGTEFGSQGMLVGIIPTITSLGGLLALHISARDFGLIFKYSSQEIHDHHGLLVR